MKPSIKQVVAAAMLLAIPAAMAQWKTLSAPLTTQEHGQWCWAASSKAVLNYYAKTPSQCQVVNWAFGLNYACGNTTFKWNSDANQPNSMYGTGGSVSSQTMTCCHPYPAVRFFKSASS